MELSNKEDIINILWTSGWDSTFSLLLLMDKDVVVQPYYIIDKQRPSYTVEIESMKTIRAAIMERYPDKTDFLLPTVIIDREDIEIDRDISIKYQNLHRDTGLGSQYRWLASYAKNTGINNLHMSVVKDGRFSKLLGNYIEKIDCAKIGSYWRTHDIPEDMDISIFSYFIFPVMGYTKLDMLEVAKTKGFYDILELSWFCHHPINGKPCGICNPCVTAAEEGLANRLPKESLKRYKYRKFYTVFSKIARKLTNNSD